MMREDLIERLRAYITQREKIRDGGITITECNRVPLTLTDLREAAAALEAAREDALRLGALEAMVNESPEKALLLHHGRLPSDRYQYVGLGLSNTGRTLRQAIDQARGKGVQDEA